MRYSTRVVVATLALGGAAHAQTEQAPKAAFPASAPPAGVGTSPPAAPQAAPPQPAPYPYQYGPPPQGYWAPYPAPRQGAWAGHWEPELVRRWYGWQTLIADGISLSLWIGGAAAAGSSSRTSTAESAVIVGGFLGYLFAAPIVHAGHGHWGKFGASLGLRGGSTALAVIGVAGCEGRSRCDGGYGALLVIGALGIIAAIPIDAALIANEDVVPEQQAVTLSPWIDSDARGGGVLVGRMF